MLVPLTVLNADGRDVLGSVGAVKVRLACVARSFREVSWGSEEDRAAGADVVEVNNWAVWGCDCNWV
jgi:hypothetical protein